MSQNQSNTNQTNTNQSTNIKKCIRYKLQPNNSFINQHLSLQSECDDQIKAIAFFNGQNEGNISGTVKFEELNTDNVVKITVNLQGFIPNTKHGFHVHEAGDLSNGCTSMCAHFNPFGKTHGGRNDLNRHVGDLGNIIADANGNVIEEFTDNLIKLRGSDANIIGRGLIIHENEDDCGKGNNEESLKTGNAGKRIACAIIGYASC